MNGRAALVTVLLAVALCGVCAASGKVRIGILTDGPMERELLPPSLFEAEANAVLAGSPAIEMPEILRRNGEWSPAGINAQLDALLADPGVDMILTLGLMSSNQAARRTTLVKPVIAPFVADAVLERYPLAGGKSGRRNFTYVADFIGLKDQLRSFSHVVRYRHLAAIVDQLELAGIPDLGAIAEQVRSEGARITIVPGGQSAADSLAAIPADADAVFVAPLPRLSIAQLRELADGLVARRLPSLATTRAEVEAGLLMASAGSAADQSRLARRIALVIQRIHGGEDAADIEVALQVQRRPVLNMRTARRIGFSPRWADLSDAEQLYAEEPAAAGRKMSLVAAMRRALEANPSLAASELAADLAKDDVDSARANLLPQIDATTTATRIDSDHAGALTQPERSATAELNLRQVIFSESAWSGYAIAKHLAAAADAASRTSMLDTLQSAAAAYLNLLRAKSVEAVRRANVDNTRRNLETSRVREAVGLSERSDYLRWVSQLARDQANLLDAQATRRQAETELARVLHIAGAEPIDTVDTGLDEPTAFIADARTQSYIDTPAKWAVFGEFSVDAARRSAPEIEQVEAQLAAGRRGVDAANRAFYLPELALVSGRDDQYWRDGKGASPPPGAPGSQSWRVSLQASFPLFSGGARRAELGHARHALRQVSAQRDAILDGVDARVRASLQRIAASYPSIELSRASAAAAGENMRMVGDAYARGIVTVTELTDAQDANLSAELAAAQAKYDFLSDFVDVLRATGSFAVLLDPQSRMSWYDELDHWYRDHGQAQRR